LKSKEGKNLFIREIKLTLGVRLLPNFAAVSALRKYIRDLA
jgi:hypothetical protein